MEVTVKLLTTLITLLLVVTLISQIEAKNFEENFILKKNHSNFKGSTEYFNFVSSLSVFNLEGQAVKEDALLKHLKITKNKKAIGEWAKQMGKSFSEEQQSIKNWSLIRTGFADGVELAGEAVETFVSSGGIVTELTSADKIANLASFSTKVISKGVRLFDEYRVDRLTSENMDNFTKMTVDFLRAKFDSGMNVNDIKTMNDEQRYDLYNELRSKYYFEPEDFRQWPDKAKNLYIMKKLSKIAKIQIAFQEKNDAVMSKIDVKIEQLADSIRIQGQKFKNDFEQFKKSGEKVNEKLEIVKVTQVSINTKLGVIYSRINKNSDTLNEVHEDVMFVKIFAMGQMSATQQKVLIKNKILNLKNISGKDKYIESLQKYAKQLDTLADVEKVQSEMKKLTTNAAHFFQIGNNLGIVSDEAMNDVNTGINAIMSGVNIYGGIKAHNPTAVLEGVSCITSILGKKKTNPEAERHKQIMNGINKLLKGQQTILKHIGKLQEFVGEAFCKLAEQMNVRFDQVVSNQRIIIRTLENLDKKITEHYINTRHMLDTIYWSTLTNREMLNYVITQDMTRGCDNFIDKMYNERPQSFDKFKEVFEDNGSYFKECFDGLRRTYTFTNQSKSSPIDQSLKYSWHCEKRDVGETDYFANEIYERTVNFAFKYTDLIGIDYRNLISSTFVPVRNVLDLDEKNGKDKLNHLSGDFYNGKRYDMKSLIKVLIHPEFLYESSSFLLETYTYLDLTKPGSDLGKYKLKTKEEVFSTVHINPLAETLVNNSLKAINTSMAQMNLLSGDMIILMLDKIFDQKFTGKAEDLKDVSFREAMDLLYFNNLIAHNFLIYRLKKDLKKNKNGYLGYAMALKQENNRVLEEITNSPWVFFKSNKSGDWKAKFYRRNNKNKDELFEILLPSAGEIEKGDIVYKSSFVMLSELKQRVENAVLSYRLPRRNIDTKKILFSLQILQNME